MSYIIYEGPSVLDQKPIVVILTEEGKSKNVKTGGMAQTYILRSDIPPLEAVKTGEDVSICGMCPHRPKLEGSCYVNVGQGPSAIYRAYKAGRYEHKYPWLVGIDEMIRIGSYGDPGAVPPGIWFSLIENAKGWTEGTCPEWAINELPWPFKIA